MKQSELFKIIKKCLKTKSNIDLKSSSRNIEEWDFGSIVYTYNIDKNLK